MSSPYTEDQIRSTIDVARKFLAKDDFMQGSQRNGVMRGLVEIIEHLRMENERYRAALDASVSLQSHYAMLLNGWDGGERMQFASSDDWINRLTETKERAQ